MSSHLEKPWDRDDATELRRAAEIQRIRSIVEGHSAAQKEEAAAAAAIPPPRSSSATAAEPTPTAAQSPPPPPAANVAAHDEQLRMLVDMGFPHERCVEALQRYGHVGNAMAWLLEPPIPGSNSGASQAAPSTRVSAQVQILLFMGFPHERCVEALRENDGDVDRAVNQLLSGPLIDSIHPTGRPPQAAGEWRERGRIDFHPQPESFHSLNPMPTAGGGNCLFYALLGALADFSERRRQGHVFPHGRLPSSHDLMRRDVVDFASRNRNQCSLFVDNSNEVELAHSIDADSRSRIGNDSILGGGRFASVDEYFQARRCFALLLNPSSHSCFSDHV